MTMSSSTATRRLGTDLEHSVWRSICALSYFKYHKKDLKYTISSSNSLGIEVYY